MVGLGETLEQQLMTINPNHVNVAHKMAGDIAFVLDAHANFSRQEKDAVRRFDMATPYAVHPVWCAMTIMQESKLDLPVRCLGSRVLLYHDVPEDTTMALPDSLTSREQELIKGMTFASLDEEMRLIWERESLIWLFKLYDKTSNLADGSWMTPERRAQVVPYVAKLRQRVAAGWGNLNIVHMSQALCR